ncbi:MAG TPA: hypothetical protein VNS11_01855 [Sphingomicrobium sp.]|nr:hypothetical protein [Sphingomicrobium sp.]
MAAVFAICAQAAPAAATPQMARFRTIKLKDARSISEATTVNSAIDAMMAVAGSCHAHGLEAALRCACSATADLERLKAVYRQTALRHPDWYEANTIVSYQNPQNGHFILLNFAALTGMIGGCEKR